MRKLFQLLKHGLFAFGAMSFLSAANAEEISLGLPVDCNLNKDCFIQNLPDLIEGEGQSDSFCQGATYDGHKGVDIRLLSIKDIERNVPVIAAVDGVVKAFRDGIEDKLPQSEADWEEIKGRECGNGIVLTHHDGYETQFCHLKENSISVKVGDEVKQGDLLGFVGNSGAAEFPHVHLSLRKNGQWIDPVTGKKPSQTCTSDNASKSLFNDETDNFFTENTSRLLTSGIAGSVIDHNDLVKLGAPENVNEGDEAIVGWGWFINLRKGDQIRFILEGPNGIIAENTSEPLEGHKADYSAFSGKRQIVEAGEYKLNTELLRNGETIAQSLFVHIVE